MLFRLAVVGYRVSDLLAVRNRATLQSWRVTVRKEEDLVAMLDLREQSYRELVVI